jgi:hypothetical protein
VRAVHVLNVVGGFSVEHSQRCDEERVLARPAHDAHRELAAGKATLCDTDDAKALA